MKYRSESWALVLAGGDGSRLTSLTQNSDGTAVPKQFCSLGRGESLLSGALHRARAIASPDRVCTIVAAQHRAWWSDGMLAGLPDENVFIQPHNRGTAYGILLALMRIAARDPDAIVVLLPADHYFEDEATIAASLRRVAGMAVANHNTIYLLGIKPDEADPGLGYVLPSSSSRKEPFAHRALR